MVSLLHPQFVQNIDEKESDLSQKDMVSIDHQGTCKKDPPKHRKKVRCRAAES
jgi:hypothetical protein